MNETEAKAVQAGDGETAPIAAPAAGIAPRDAIEAMLAAQMAAVHEAALRALKRAAECTEYPQIEALYLRQAARLMNLFVRQTEALERRRVAADERAEEKARAAYFRERKQRQEEELRRREEQRLKTWGIRPPGRSRRRTSAHRRDDGSVCAASELPDGVFIPDPLSG